MQINEEHSWRKFSSLVISVIYEEKNQIKPNKLELKISLTHKNQRKKKPTNKISRLLKDIRRDVMGPNVYLLRLLLDRTCVKSLFYILSLFSLFSPCRDNCTHVKSIISIKALLPKKNEEQKSETKTKETAVEYSMKKQECELATLYENNNNCHPLCLSGR